MASFGIGAKLRQERVGKGLAIDDIARDTRISPRFLEAIETDDYSTLPGLIFARNFVRQYALTLQLDPNPLLAALPKQDELTVPLPNPPARAHSSYYSDRRLRSLLFSIAWLVFVCVAGVAAYVYYSSAPRAASAKARSSQADAPRADAHAAASRQTPTAIERTKEVGPAVVPPPTASTTPAASAPVQVSLTASERAWVQVSVDGKTTFIGTLTPNETRDISAAEQVTVLTGNAGALTISVNGKTLESLGPRGHVREVRLTAEGPQFLSKDPPPAPDPL